MAELVVLMRNPLSKLPRKRFFSIPVFLPEICVDHMTSLVMQVRNPLGKLPRLRYGRRQKDIVQIVRQQNCRATHFPT
jgi:hypothetical protein